MSARCCVLQGREEESDQRPQMKLVGKRKESNIPCEIQTTLFLQMISTMRAFYMRVEDDREIAEGKIAVGRCVKMMLVLRRRPSTRGAVAFCSRFWAWSSVVLFTKLRKEMFTIIWRWWCWDRRMEKVLGMANNVQRCSVDAKLSGVAHVQLDAYSEAHHFARRAVYSCWMECVFSCVFEDGFRVGDI